MSNKQFATAICRSYLFSRIEGGYKCFYVDVTGIGEYCPQYPIISHTSMFIAFMGLLGWEFKQVVDNSVGLKKREDIINTYYFTQALPLNNSGTRAAVKELNTYNNTNMSLDTIDLDGVDYIDLR